MDACKQALEDPDGEHAENVDKNIKIVDEEMNLNYERAQKRLEAAQQFDTSLEIQALFAAKMKNLRSHCTAPFLAELLEDKLIDALQLGYADAEKGVKSLLLNLIEYGTIDIIQLGKMGWLLMMISETPQHLRGLWTH